MFSVLMNAIVIIFTIIFSLASIQLSTAAPFGGGSGGGGGIAEMLAAGILVKLLQDSF